MAHMERRWPRTVGHIRDVCGAYGLSLDGSF